LFPGAVHGGDQVEFMARPGPDHSSPPGGMRSDGRTVLGTACSQECEPSSRSGNVLSLSLRRRTKKVF
jgi:hypothetical protein